MKHAVQVLVKHALKGLLFLSLKQRSFLGTFLSFLHGVAKVLSDSFISLFSRLEMASSLPSDLCVVLILALVLLFLPASRPALCLLFQD